MTRVDFYLGGDGLARDTLACRLVETAHRHGHRVFLWVPKDEIGLWDERLWTFSDTSFVPHAPAGLADEPVLIGAELPHAGDCLVPLTADAPPSVTAFARVLEAVGATDSEKERSRARFRHYRRQGLEPVVHNLP
ncbi:DNA polymerase III subunit chi [Acidiferrobacter thiooxydans]|jgi:DNA polymerase IIIc chi subunit|uniref:DNA polymerase III subunit chi n=1 Tax=Acidiferrobacter thiooxydans TaxID=163359 RepID=A0A1C2G4S1_9GAMM|nr:DNA polymerase III subunit chi [Acidiferrobacter thiooxydans]MDA8191164.1 DNA polymerase III subunit chi [Gammaproteobacteria bacterium]RCN58927.1 DNA polymerase III subunit chi [Acidiferrobacter thiooxydans]UEO00646.1 DNA polymerase III subunit chi [Acidiferrobacter thiooxydans]